MYIYVCVYIYIHIAHRRSSSIFGQVFLWYASGALREVRSKISWENWSAMGKSTISMGRFEQQTVSHCQRVRYSPQIIHFQQISRIITYYNPSQPLIIIFPRKTGVEMPHFTPRMSAWTMCDNYKLEGIPCTKADHVGVRLGFNVIQLVTIPI